MQPTRQIGNGLTKHDVYEWELPDADPAEVLFVAEHATHTLTEVLEEVVQTCRRALERQGWPSDQDQALVYQTGGAKTAWTYAGTSDIVELKAGQGITRAEGFITQHCEYQSKDWYRAKLLFWDWRIRVGDTEGSRREAAVRLAQLAEQFIWKFKHENAAMDGHRAKQDRQQNQPKATEQRKRDAEARTKTIARAAESLIAGKPNLARNDAALARALLKHSSAEVSDHRGEVPSQRTIRTHLRKARLQGLLT